MGNACMSSPVDKKNNAPPQNTSNNNSNDNNNNDTSSENKKQQQPEMKKEEQIINNSSNANNNDNSDNNDTFSCENKKLLVQPEKEEEQIRSNDNNNNTSPQPEQQKIDENETENEKQEDNEQQATTSSSGSKQQQQQPEKEEEVIKKLRIVHWNDAYNIFPGQDGSAGAARFVGYVNSLKKGGSRYNGCEPCILFSGDLLSPSSLSASTLGMHMLPVVNALGMKASIVANHDLDLGISAAEQFFSKCNFPWIVSNAFEKQGNKKANVRGRRLCGCESTTIIERSEFGIKIGIMALIEPEWVATLYSVDSDALIVDDFCQVAREESKKLREQGCELIIALTHMRVPRDIKLLENCGDVIDVQLGAHDHGVNNEEVPPFGTRLIKSGADFKMCSVLDIEVHIPSSTSSSENNNKRAIKKCDVELVHITADMPEDAEVAAQVEKYSDEIMQKDNTVIGYSAVDLDIRTSSVRTQETAIANFVADCIMEGCKSFKIDAVLFNAGGLRTDAILPAGEISAGDLMRCMPTLDPIRILAVSGQILLESLENAVSQYPAQEGRFCAISGIKFKFKKSGEPGSRVVFDSVVAGKEKLNLQKIYRVAFKAYIAKGRDGYDCLENQEILYYEDDCPSINNCVRNHFLYLDVIREWKQAAAPDYRSRTCKNAALKLRSLSLKNKNQEEDEDEENQENDDEDDNEDADDESDDEDNIVTKMTLRLLPKNTAINPRVEGRIVAID